jgi:hypothetical protein
MKKACFLRLPSPQHQLSSKSISVVFGGMRQRLKPIMPWTEYIHSKLVPACGRYTPSLDQGSESNVSHHAI